MIVPMTSMQKKFLVTLFAKLSTGQENKAVYSYLCLKLKKTEVDLTKDEMVLTLLLIERTLDHTRPLLERTDVSAEAKIRADIVVNVFTELAGELKGKLECNKEVSSTTTTSS